ncbi:MAG: DUF2141 domain-containing protein [Bacteroidetes bacterium]|nr:MAG: DUF2141 domain-containing protein [Bacteroidota bacterium]
MYVLILVLLAFSASLQELSLVFTNIEEPAGSLYIAVFDNAGDYLNPEKARFQQIVPVGRNGSVEVRLPEVPPGTYALSCFHDVNNNGVLDKNFMGIPREPYCFSNNVRPRFRAPSWEEAKFTFKPGQKQRTLRLETW